MMPRSNKSFKTWCIENNCTGILSHLVNKKDADNYSYQSHCKVDWRCDLGHIFSADFCKFSNPHRSSYKKFNCPICNGQMVLVGYNDLGTLYPDLAKEWDMYLNDIRPKDVTVNSHKYIWWKCKYGHSWKAKVYARVSGNGCPYCSKGSRSSQPEQLVYLYCKKYFPDTLSMTKIGKINVDIYIPSLKIAIEYDGSIWHQISNTDYKYEKLKEVGITLYTISGVSTSRPNTYVFNDDNLRIFNYPNNLTFLLSKLFKDIFDIDLDFSDYKSMCIKSRDLYYSSCNTSAVITDKMREMWSPLNNYPIELISNDSCDKYWRCNLGHTFRRRYDVMKRGSTDCPYCKNRSSFNYFIIYTGIDFGIVLDMSNGDLEFMYNSDLLKYINLGVNIRGIFINNSSLNYDKYYLRNISATGFRNSFDRFYNLGFTCKSNNDICIKVTNYINMLFNNYSAEKVHSFMIRLLEGDEYV